jgi:hypothetical protein
MVNEPKKLDARPVFRWLAGLTCPVFLAMAVLSAFPGVGGLGDKPQYSIAALFLWGAFFFGTIAARGRVYNPGSERAELAIAAKKYVAGEISLDEYGSQTKQILRT